VLGGTSRWPQRREKSASRSSSSPKREVLHSPKQELPFPARIGRRGHHFTRSSRKKKARTAFLHFPDLKKKGGRRGGRKHAPLGPPRPKRKRTVLFLTRGERRGKRHSLFGAPKRTGPSRHLSSLLPEEEGGGKEGGGRNGPSACYLTGEISDYHRRPFRGKEKEEGASIAGTQSRGPLLFSPSTSGREKEKGEGGAPPR